MGLTDGEDLFDVMPSVNELEPAPMIDVQGAKDRMSGEAGGRAEEAFGFAANLVEAGEMFVNCVGESIAG
jgi:hypothetical protein